MSGARKYLSGFLLLLLFAGFFPGRDDVYFNISKNIDLFSRIYKEISFSYVDEVDPDKFMRAGIEGMLGSLDPYTVFIDEKNQDEIDLITNGKYGGVGITVGIRGNNVIIIEVLDGYSAQKQGIRVGDVLIEASGKKVAPKNLNDVLSLVKGEPGTAVDVKVLRNEGQDTVAFNLIREEIIIKNISFAGFYPEESNNVYIKLSNFSRTAADELKTTLRELKAEKEVSSIILDLRGNPGGLLDIAVDICDKFLAKDQLIVTTRGRDEASNKSYFAKEEPMVGNSKLVVLVNEGSASASEIVAGAIQDHDRGVIIGTKTFGKGLVQTITPLNYNTSLKITTAKYYTPSGRCIQKVDYSQNNNIITNGDTLQGIQYLTDNKRKVYGSGGISPDSVVTYIIEGGITKELLAKGLFFQFADAYFYKNNSFKYTELKDGKLYEDFLSFINDKKFEYISDAEKEIDRLMKQAMENKLDNAIQKSLLNIKEEFNKIEHSEFALYRNEILREIRTELASRYLGTRGRFKESLNSDPQFKTALSVISDSKLYNRLLSIN